MIITASHTFIYIIITTSLGLLYGYLGAHSNSLLLSLILVFSYLLLLGFSSNLYFTGKSWEMRKYLTLIIFLATFLAWYSSWSLWILLRSDSVLNLITEPGELLHNIVTMAQDKNHILVRLWYLDIFSGSWQYYYLWLLEFFTCVLMPFFLGWMAIPVRRKQLQQIPEL